MATVVLADDHALLRAGLRRLLDISGHAVLAEVGDGLAVASVVADVEPDVLLLDLGLPGLHGLDALPQVRQRTPSVRVLVLSAYSRAEFVVTALRRGASGYLLKSSAADELIRAVEIVAAGGVYVDDAVAGAIRAVAVGPNAASDGRASRSADAYETLTARQRQVFLLMADGLSSPAIAERLAISARTAEHHRLVITHKLGVRTQTDVVLFALRLGLLALDDADGAPRIDRV